MQKLVRLERRRTNSIKHYEFNQIGNLIAGRGERPFAPTTKDYGFNQIGSLIAGRGERANGRSPLLQKNGECVRPPIQHCK